MVTEAILGVLAGIVNGLLSLVPAWAPDTSSLSVTTASVGAWAFAWNGYFPVAVLGVCLGIVLAFKIALLAWRLITFGYHQFWGSS